MEVHNIEEFKALIAGVRENELYRQVAQGNIHKAVFRGQEDDSWSIIPKLLRSKHSIADIKIIEHELLDEFKSQLRSEGYYKYFQTGFIGDKKFHSNWLFIQQAQHVGLATRFLDWSLNPEIACFFACLGSPDKDAAFYILYPEAEWFQADRPEDTYAEFDPLTFPESVLLNPSGFMADDYDLKFLERFKVRQHGRFLVRPIVDESIQCLTSQKFFSGIIEKHIIKKEAKKQLLNNIGLSTDFVYMENDPLVQKVHPPIKSIIDKLHSKYELS